MTALQKLMEECRSKEMAMKLSSSLIRLMSIQLGLDILGIPFKPVPVIEELKTMVFHEEQFYHMGFRKNNGPIMGAALHKVLHNFCEGFTDEPIIYQ